MRRHRCFRSSSVKRIRASVSVHVIQKKNGTEEEPCEWQNLMTINCIIPPSRRERREGERGKPEFIWGRGGGGDAEVQCTYVANVKHWSNSTLHCHSSPPKLHHDAPPHLRLHSKNKIAGRFIPFLVLGLLWDKNTGRVCLCMYAEK